MDPIPADFAGGYLAHLLTDRLWWQTVITPFRKKFPSNFPEPEFRSLYYRDTDRIDLDLYRQMPWRPQAWSSLEAVYSHGFCSIPDCSRDPAMARPHLALV